MPQYRLIDAGCHGGVRNRHGVGGANEMLRDVPADERYAICAGNMVGLYELPQTLTLPGR